MCVPRASEADFCLRRSRDLVLHLTTWNRDAELGGIRRNDDYKTEIEIPNQILILISLILKWPYKP